MVSQVFLHGFGDFHGVIKKNVPWHILAPRAVACDNLHLRASAHLWHVSAFLCNREFLGISCYIKKADLQRQHVTCRPAFLIYKILILVQEILNNNILRLFLGKSQRPEL